MSKEKTKGYKAYSTKKVTIIICVIMLVAIILGVYGQSIAYYISDTVEWVSPIYCLTALTVISITLFLITPILIYRYMKIEGHNKPKLIPFIIISSLIGTLISMFSLFATIMWWG